MKSRFGMLFITLIAIFLLLMTGAYFFQEKLIFFPDKLPVNYQYHFDHEFEEKNFKVDDDIAINALHFKADESKGIVFYSHGNAGCLNNWGFIANDFLQHNYDLLIYDYRGYGKSNGSISEENLYHDADFIYEKLLNDYDENQIIVYGRSIGTGVASMIASRHNPKLLILESPYFNLPDLVKRIFPFIPSFMIRYKLANNELIKNISCQVAIFHGTSDEVIYFGSSLKLEKLLKDGDRFIPIEGGHHNDLSQFEVYQQELASLLK